MPSSSARSTPCSGPAPPNGTSVNRRGSWPRSIETSRIAPTIEALTTARMPSAASSSVSPSGPAIFSRIARSAASRSSVTAPPTSVGGIRPSTRWASVTVGSVPPLP